MTRLLPDQEVYARSELLRLALEKSQLSLLVDAMKRGRTSKALPRLAERLHRDAEALRRFNGRRMVDALAYGVSGIN